MIRILSSLLRHIQQEQAPQGVALFGAQLSRPGFGGEGGSHFRHDQARHQKRMAMPRMARPPGWPSMRVATRMVPLTVRSTVG